MIIMYCKLNIKICCHPIKKKNDTQSVHVPVYFLIVFTEELLTQYAFIFNVLFSPFLTEPCCYDKISLAHYCPLSSLIRFASCHVVPVEFSPVWSRSHIHKVLSPELFKNITKKSHTKLQSKRETIYFEHPEKHSG